MEALMPRCSTKTIRRIAFEFALAYSLLSLYLIYTVRKDLSAFSTLQRGLLPIIPARLPAPHEPPAPLAEDLDDDDEDDSSSGQPLCVLIGIFCRGSEYDLRQWQRNHFAEFRHHHHHHHRRRDVNHAHNSSVVQLRFPVAYNQNDAQMNDLLVQEQHRHGDLLFLPMAEDYKWLTAKTLEFFKIAVATMLKSDNETNNTSSHNNACQEQGRYVVKADSDVIISYAKLLDIMRVVHVPKKESVYMGQMQPDTPMHDRWMRKKGGYTLSRLPIWSVGQIYALSFDLVQKLVRDNVIRTVFKAEEGYVYPEEDRAIGLALKRASIVVEHQIHLRHLYLFCHIQDLLLDCERLNNFTAIGVGFGLSGSDSESQVKKLELLKSVSRQAQLCHTSAIRKRLAPTTADDPFVRVDQTFLQPLEPQQYFFDECPSLTSLGKQMKQQFLVESKQIDIEFNEESRLERECSDVAYWLNYPHYKTTNTLLSARDHFLSIGSKDSASSYYCPKKCFNATCTICNRETAYIESYPDIAEAVNSGALENVTQHFLNHGQSEGRVFPCFPRYLEHGFGSNQGCEMVFRKFIESTKPAVAAWPLVGKEDAMSQNAIVFCEGRHHEWTDYVLRVARRFTGPDWLFYLVGPPALTSVWKLHYEGPQIQIVTLPPDFGDLSVYPDQINKLFLSKFLWNETVQRENVLVVQSDSLLLRHGIEDFFEYDYVGSPVYPESFPDMNWRILCAKHFRCGGNGGLSFRKRSSILYLLDHCAIPKDLLEEDQWYSACMADFDMNLPHPIIANRFSVGSKCDIDVPFGTHKLWQNCMESTCMEALVESELFTDIYGEHHQSDAQCPEGTAYYLLKNKDVAESRRDGFDHYVRFGKSEGRRWICLDNVTKPQWPDSPYAGIPPAWLQSSSFFVKPP